MTNLQTLSVLMIEDDEDDYLILNRLLKKTDGLFSLTWAPGYDAGIKLICNQNFDICFIDFRLGKKTGIDILKSANHLAANTAMIMLTGLSDEFIGVKAIKSGADDYLIKGEITPDLLKRTIRYSLERRKLWQQKETLIKTQSVEQTKRTEQKKFLRIFENMSEAFFSLDKNWTVIYTNSLTSKILHLRRSKILGKNLWNDFQYTKETIIEQKFKEAVITQRAAHFEVFYQPLLLWFEVHAYPSSDGLSVYFHNISEKKKARNALLETRRKIMMLTDSNLIGILFTNVSGRITYANKAFLNLLGYSKQDLSLGKLNLIELTPPEWQELDKEKLKEALVNNSCIPYEKEYISKQGVKVPVLLGFVLFGESKEDIVAFIIDITKQKELEHQKDEFIGVASHELKTPITSLKAFTQVLIRQFEKKGENQAAIMMRKMDNQINKLTGLINDLLNVTKIQSGKLQLNETLYDFNTLVTEVVEDMKPTSSKHQFILKLDRGVQVFGDKERIRQVIINFLSNAIKYSPQTEKIIVSSELKENVITLSVKDYGIGISKKYLNHIFERFYRIDDIHNQTISGLGLGLFICQDIINRQRGTIGVKSTKGKGSNFYFSLPVYYKIDDHSDR